jgi:hypothetical protein
VSTWTYKTQDVSIRHMGPMAQDLFAAFELGESNLLINTVDIDGINLAGVKALTDRTDALKEQVQALTARNAELAEKNAAQEREIAELRARLDRIERALAGTRP